MLRRKIEELEKSIEVIKLENKISKLKATGVIIIKGSDNKYISLSAVPRPPVKENYSLN